jgi:HrpA-like RNA helicase
VLSTNIAETSITISGIRYVVDTGMSKVRTFNPKIGIETLAVQPVSKASAMQRTGRAGREAPGACFRLYTLLKASGVEDVASFEYMDKPSRSSSISHIYINH